MTRQRHLLSVGDAVEILAKQLKALVNLHPMNFD